MLDSLPLAEVIKAMRSISSQGTKMIHIRIPKLVTYGIQIHLWQTDTQVLSNLTLFSILIAKE